MQAEIQPSIYKINRIVNNSIASIHVFYGERGEDVSSRYLEELFQKDPENILFSNIFNPFERNNIRTNNISVFFSKFQLHYDDNIETVKYKIMLEFSKLEAFSLEEIYLYCIKETVLNPTTIYQLLTQNGKLDLTEIRLDQFLFNVRDENGQSIQIKKPNKGVDEVYTYDDILSLQLYDKPYWLNTVLGQKLYIVSNEYPFICNPFEVVKYDEFAINATRKSLSTLNSHLLLNTGDILGNNIYLCLAQDVLQYGQTKDVSDLYTIQLYYPFLFKRDVQSIETLLNGGIKEELIEENKKRITDKVIDTFKSVDLIYDIYKERKNELKYIPNGTGIKYIKVAIRPQYNVRIPLDVIFKLIHAEESRPLIKYNPATRQENIYRLYAPELATDGRKIPYLNKATISTLSRTIGKTQSVSVSIQYTSNKNTYSLICEFDENGNIVIESEFVDIMSIDSINELFVIAVNPIITDIKNYVEQNGYTISLFSSLLDDKIDIRQLVYQSSIEITRTINLSDIIGCISSAFIIENKNIDSDTGIEMRFKRVSNFNKRTSQEAFIIEKQKQGMRDTTIVEALVENYDMDQDEAIHLLAKMASELQVERGIRGSDIEIKINPGFKTYITMNKLTNVLKNAKNIITVRVESINDMHYFNTIPIYIDTLIRLTQDSHSTNVPLTRIHSICSNGNVVDITPEEITASSEKSFLESEMPTIIGDELLYDEEQHGLEKEKAKNALSLFFDEDEDEEEEEDEGEGNGRGQGRGKKASMKKQRGQMGGKTPTSDSEDGDDDEDGKSGDEEEEDNNSDLLEEGILGLDELEGLSDLDESGDSPLLSENIKIEVKEKSVKEKAVKEKVVKEKAVKEKVVKEKKSSKPGKTNILGSEQNIEKKLDGIKLTNKSNPFFNKMFDHDPVLFLKKKEGKFNAYSRVCSSAARRQPVLLTDEELARVQEEQPGFLKPEDVIKYGSEPDKQYNYICPRYWCLKTQSPISPKDAKEGIKCGKIIPRDAKEVPAGHYVYEFRNDQEHGSDKNYKQHYPGFIKEGNHPNDDLCIPCCFKNWDVPGQRDARTKCLAKSKKAPLSLAEESKEENVERLDVDEEDISKISKKPPSDIPNLERELSAKMEKDDVLSAPNSIQIQKKEIKQLVVDKGEEYILGPEYYPLDKQRWGYLPMSIQKFLGEDNAACQISKLNTNIKPNHTCLLRHGVEHSEKQSFIACIADALFYGETLKDERGITRLIAVPTVQEMKQKIINALTIDSFITFQNGTLVTSFSEKKESNYKINLDEEKYTEYKESALYKKLESTAFDADNTHMIYFKNVVYAFENFKAFLLNKDSFIDYTYLWDIVSKKNPKLSTRGLNLIILEIPDNDMTNNVELICPTNHYSSEFYRADRHTLIILRRDNYFEPIYTYRNNVSKGLKIFKTFSEFDKHMLEKIKNVLSMIKPLLNERCRPYESMPLKYTFKEPILLNNLIDILYKIGYSIVTQVVNFNSKVIGVIATSPDTKIMVLTGFIPCKPSSINNTYEYVFMDDPSIFDSYYNTKTFLEKLYIASKYKIPCEPKIIILEDEHIVGLLTNSNQFVLIREDSESGKLINITEIDRNTYWNANNPEECSLNREFVNEDLPAKGTKMKKDKKMCVIRDSNYLVVDKEISTTSKVDSSRIKYINKIKLETNFYNIFRNTIRILLNSQENISKRKELEKEIDLPYIPYKTKLVRVVDFLKRHIVKNAIKFIDNYNYKNIDELSTCIVTPLDKCASKKPLCALSTNERGQLEGCQLVLPKKHLLPSSVTNDVYYFGKMADELIRYNRIKSFIFQPQTYLSFGTLGYNLKETELMSIQSILLAPEYYDGLIPESKNDYVNYNAYDNVEPAISQIGFHDKYIHVSNKENERYECAFYPMSKNLITSQYWKKCFPKKFFEKIYDTKHECGFIMISEIINNIKGGKLLSAVSLKQQLIREYIKYFLEDETNIVKTYTILKLEGAGGDKPRIIKEAELNENNIDVIINDNKYHVTNLDIWLLMTYYEIPSIIISSNNILETNNTHNILVTYSNEKSTNYVFITAPITKKMQYGVIHAPSILNIGINIPLSIIENPEYSEIIQTAIEQKINILEFLREFIEPVKIVPEMLIKKVKKPQEVQMVTGFVDKTKTIREKKLQRRKLRLVEDI